MEKKAIQKQLVIFLALVFFLTIAIVLALYQTMVHSQTLSTVLVIMMFIPAISMLLTRLFTREGFKNMWLLPRKEAALRYLLLGWFVPIGLIVLSILIYFLLFPQNFDPTMQAAKDAYAAGKFAIDPNQLWRWVIINALPLSALFGSIFLGIGEEWGWRGYMLPRLTKLYGVIPAVMISGLIWAVWHMPVYIAHAIAFEEGATQVWTTFGNYILLCMTLSMFFSYITLKSGGSLPAAAAHINYNAFFLLPSFFVADSSSIETFGLRLYFVMLAFLEVGIFCMIRLRREEKRGGLLIQLHEPCQPVPETPDEA